MSHHPPGQQSTVELRVIFGDTDQMGVVYYANYLRYFEAARAHFLRVRSGSYAKFEAWGFALPVTDAQVKYRASLRYDDLFRVEAKVVEVKRVTFRFTYRVLRAKHDGDWHRADLCAEGWTGHACIDKNGRPVAMPREMIDLLHAPEVR